MPRKSPATRQIERGKQKLVHPAHQLGIGMGAAKQYEKHESSSRLGRSRVTNPFHFIMAEDAALRAARFAQVHFHQPSFQRWLKQRDPKVREAVIQEYRSILKRAASLRQIGKLDRTRHEKTPDVLTPRAFNALLRAKLLQPDNKPMSVGRIDLDYFGKLNKRYNHAVGDYVVKRFTELMGMIIENRGGIIGRFGGDEFDVWLPFTPSVTTRLFDEVRSAFSQMTSDPRFVKKLAELNGGPVRRWKPITFTAGVMGTSSFSHPRTPSEMFVRLDNALKKGKRQRARTIEIEYPSE